MRWTLAILLSFVAPLAGCEKDEVRPPGAPDIDGGRRMITPPPPRPRDGGDGGGADAAVPDAATADAATPFGCIAVTEPGGSNRATVSLDAIPQPFPVRGAYAGWNVADCATPTLLAALTDGGCQPGLGQQLIFLLSRDDIGGAISPGLFNLDPLDRRVGVRYFVPVAGGAPEERGSCTGASGSITFDAVDDAPGAAVTGSFDLTLTDCATPQALSPVRALGAFDVAVPGRFDDVCR